MRRTRTAIAAVACRLSAMYIYRRTHAHTQTDMWSRSLDSEYVAAAVAAAAGYSRRCCPRIYVHLVHATRATIARTANAPQRPNDPQTDSIDRHERERDTNATARAFSRFSLALATPALTSNMRLCTLVGQAGSGRQAGCGQRWCCGSHARERDVFCVRVCARVAPMCGCKIPSRHIERGGVCRLCTHTITHSCGLAKRNGRDVTARTLSHVWSAHQQPLVDGTSGGRAHGRSSRGSFSRWYTRTGCMTSVRTLCAVAATQLRKRNASDERTVREYNYALVGRFTHMLSVCCACNMLSC